MKFLRIFILSTLVTLIPIGAQAAHFLDKIITKGDIILGNPAGNVTIIEFYDYNCSYCRQAIYDLATIVKQDNNVRVVLKDWPIFGQDSDEAAVFSTIIKKIKPSVSWPYHVKMMTGGFRANKENAINTALSLGVDKEDLMKEYSGPDRSTFVDLNKRIASGLHLVGTPSFIIDTEVIRKDITRQEMLDKIANVRECGTTTCKK